VQGFLTSPPDSNQRFPFARLCVLQSIWQFSTELPPPLLQAATWSGYPQDVLKVAQDLEMASINVIRGLAMDAVQKANSGHPGMPMGCAPMAYALWMHHLKFNPKNPRWFNRDRFVLSAGHGSMLLYALLHLTGFELSLDEIKNFRQLGSRTPGHPENTHTPGVEMATGPLGQGFASAVGMAIAEKHLAARYNRPNHSIIDHFTTLICSDGDLMEGVAREAASLAGHLKLGKLIALYDDNQITIDGSTDLAFSDDTEALFSALGWHVQKIDGMNVEAVDRALVEARLNQDRPSLIVARTVIGYGSPNKAGSSKSHGAALGPDEVRLSKAALGLPENEEFYLPEDVLAHFRSCIQRGQKQESEWSAAWDRYAEDFPDLAEELGRMIRGDLPAGWADALPTFGEALATRVASNRTVQVLASALPELIGGNADLAESVGTEIKGGGHFQAATPEGRNLCFGVREHAMAAALNGMNLHGGLRAFGGTFLVFSDYCRPSIRLAALMQCPSIFVFSHDSIGLGEDGPTHQPIEHLMSLRAIPNLAVLRPADGNETAACWAMALDRRDGPTALILTRQAVPSLTPENVFDHPARRGAYVLDSDPDPIVALIGTGSELQLCVEAAATLRAQGLPCRVVSMPSWLHFEAQDDEYQQEVLPLDLLCVSVEAGTTFGWSRYAQTSVGIDEFGASAPAPQLYEEFGITAANVVEAVHELISDFAQDDE